MIKQSNILNSLTKEEIAEIRATIDQKKKKTKRCCLQCGREHLMKTHQKFCSNACRAAAHREQTEILHELLVKERGQWALEREDLLREIRELRKQVK